MHVISWLVVYLCEIKICMVVFGYILQRNSPVLQKMNPPLWL